MVPTGMSVDPSSCERNSPSTDDDECVQYRDAVQQILHNANGIPARHDPCWSRLSAYISQSVLQDAFQKQEQARRALIELLEPVSNLITSDSCMRPDVKAMNRVQEKLLAAPEAHFVANSDFLAARIHILRPVDLWTVVQCVREAIAKAQGSYVRLHLRGGEHSADADDADADANFAFLDQRHRPTDIVLFASIYLGGIGYVMEVQFNQPLATYVFKQNSETRGGAEKQPRVKRLWNLYHACKAAMLEHPSGMNNHGACRALVTMKTKLHTYFEWLEVYHPERVGPEKQYFRAALKPWLNHP